MYKNSLLCKPNRFHFFSSIFSILFSLLLIVVFSAQSSGAAGNSFADDNITYTQKIVHKHTGNASGGGCYGKYVVNTTTIEDPCRGHMIYYPAYNKTQCDTCGASYDGDQSYRDCWTTFPKEVKETYYQLNCGYSDNQELGTYSVAQSSLGWSKEITLTMSLSSSVLSEGSIRYCVNEVPIEGNIFTVSENGTYNVNIVRSANISANPVSVVISNIDTVAPVFSVDYDTTPDIPLVNVKIISADDFDGSGLAPMPYSFDGGNTWTDTPRLEVTENQIVEIVVRDQAGNEAYESIEINNIKKPVPPTPASEATPANSIDESTQNNYSEDSEPVYNEPENNEQNNAKTQEPESQEPKEVPFVPSNSVKPSRKSNVSDSDESKKKAPINVQVTSPALKSPQKPVKKEEIRKEKPTLITQPKTSSAQSAGIESTTNVSPLAKSLLLGLSVICLGVLSALLFLLLCRITIVCNMKERDKYVFKGLTVITRREGLFEINISQALFEKCDTGKLLIKMPVLFSFIHKDEDLIIYLPDKQSYTATVASKIYLSLKIR